VVGGKLRAEPLRERIPVLRWEIFVNSSEDAVAIVKTLLTSTVRFENSTSDGFPAVRLIILKASLSVYGSAS